MWKFLLLISFISASSVEEKKSLAKNNASSPLINDQNLLVNLTNAHSATPSQSMGFEKSNLLFLSEMPLEQLLKVKKSIEEIQQVGRGSGNTEYSNYNKHNQVTENVATTNSDGTTLEGRIINEEPSMKFELAHGKVKSSAMPLINVKQQQHNHLQQQQFQQTQPTINRKTGYGELEGPWNTKPSKIQSFFQISVTALAFLAFAGYLLCMIVQAIKSKGTTLLMTNSNMPMQSATLNNMSSGGSVPLRRRRPIAVGRRRKRNIVLLSSENHNDTLSTLYEESQLTPFNIDGDMYHAMINLAEGYVKLNYFENEFN